MVVTMGFTRLNGIHDCNGRWAAGRSYLYVFMARDGDGPMYVKVGKSNDPITRLGDLQTGCPFPIVKAGMVKCLTEKQSFRFEKRLHVELAKYNSQGEWFKFDWSKPEQKCLVADAIEVVLAELKDWLFEEIDIEKAASMMRAIMAERQRKYRAKNGTLRFVPKEKFSVK